MTESEGARQEGGPSEEVREADADSYATRPPGKDAPGRGGGGRSRGDDGSQSGRGLPLELGVLLAVVLSITLLFLAMIGDFLLTLILAGIFAGMARPVFLWLTDVLGDRRRIASMFTVVALLLLILGPLGAFLALVVSQAVEVSGQAGPWIQSQAGRWPELTVWLQELPMVGQFMPDQAELVQRASELVTRIGSFVINNLGAATSGTLNVVLQLFVMLYAIYFFLLDGPAILGRILYYTPLKQDDERELVEQFVSVTRATIKGSILVG
ncbi:MAG TPA: AI-2E family transporter, partial [Longimicrobiales bacterium]|nr:AI-2E family transporter [Longimicrobiales bacterium]